MGLESTPHRVLLFRIRVVLGVFLVGLIASGLTAFPLLTEIEWLASMRGLSGQAGGPNPAGFDAWLLVVRDGLRETYRRYPWIGYGTDWLAFAHLVIAVFFVGPFRDPVRNVWILWSGVIACAGVIPLALLAGAARGIPWGWRMIDSSFGVFGVLPLLYCLGLVRRMGRNLDSDA